MIHLIVALLLMNPAASAVVQDHDHDEKAKEEEARKKVAAFQKEIAKAKPDDKPACIDTLAELQHPKILDELVTWLTKGTKECQTTAARHVGEYAKNQKAAEALLKAVKAHKDPEIIETLLDEAANVGYRGIAKNLAIFFRHAQIQVAKAAVDATGSLKSKDSIPPLVDLVRELEAIHDGDFGASGTGGSQPGQPPGSNTPPPSQSKGYDDKQKRKLEVLPAAIAALRRITGQDFEKAVEWTGWWAKNAKTFKEPED